MVDDFEEIWFSKLPGDRHQNENKDPHSPKYVVDNHVFEGLAYLICNHVEHVDYLCDDLDVDVWFAIGHLFVIPIFMWHLFPYFVFINGHLALVLPESLNEVNP